MWLGLHLNNIPTVEIANGDNLLKPWIELFVKLNKSFIVRRSLSNGELLASSLLLSDILGIALLKEKAIYGLQREGRAKTAMTKQGKPNPCWGCRVKQKLATISSAI